MSFCIISYSGRSAHIVIRSRFKSTDKSMTCTQVSESIDNHLVVSQSMERQVSRSKNTKTNSRPNRAVWTVSVNCAHWRGSTLPI